MLGQVRWVAEGARTQTSGLSIPDEYVSLRLACDLRVINDGTMVRRFASLSLLLLSPRAWCLVRGAAHVYVDTLVDEFRVRSFACVELAAVVEGRWRDGVHKFVCAGVRVFLCFGLSTSRGSE